MKRNDNDIDDKLNGESYEFLMMCYMMMVVVMSSCDFSM